MHSVCVCVCNNTHTLIACQLYTYKRDRHLCTLRRHTMHYANVHQSSYCLRNLKFCSGDKCRWNVYPKCVRKWWFCCAFHLNYCVFTRIHRTFIWYLKIPKIWLFIWIWVDFSMKIMVIIWCVKKPDTEYIDLFRHFFKKNNKCNRESDFSAVQMTI